MEKIKTKGLEVYKVLHERDYLNFVTKSTTKEQRDKFFIGDFYINAIVCKKCKSYVRSKNKHDFRYCSCKSCAVDGGSHYQRIIGEPEDYIPITELFYDAN